MLKRWKIVQEAQVEEFQGLSYISIVEKFFNPENYDSSFSSYPYFYGTVEEIANCEFHTGMVFLEC